jgi:hypothetical protein
MTRGLRRVGGRLQAGRCGAEALLGMYEWPPAAVLTGQGGLAMARMAATRPGRRRMTSTGWRPEIDACTAAAGTAAGRVRYATSPLYRRRVAGRRVIDGLPTLAWDLHQRCWWQCLRSCLSLTAACGQQVGEARVKLGFMLA